MNGKKRICQGIYNLTLNAKILTGDVVKHYFIIAYYI